MSFIKYIVPVLFLVNYHKLYINRNVINCRIQRKYLLIRLFLSSEETQKKGTTNFHLAKLITYYTQAVMFKYCTVLITKHQSLCNMARMGRHRNKRTEERFIAQQINATAQKQEWVTLNNRLECKMFMNHSAEKLSEKDVEGHPFVISWLGTRVSFKILKSVNTTL